ncbi:MAG: YvcK family protein [Cyanobacteria bacterium]|nr:YvcK family protein [Cyanobacteriota bacterium]
MVALRHRMMRHRTPRQVNQWFKWLSPGLFVKRWLLVSAGGVLLLGLGVLIWTKQTPVFYVTQVMGSFVSAIAVWLPHSVSGPALVAAGLALVFWGQTRTFESITEVLMPDHEEDLVDRLLTHRRLNRGPRIVAIGGGTGLSTLLRGLKNYSSNVTAIVTVADDGGSSGRLRREMGVLPPGDIRNCLAALSAEERLMTALFQYRFEVGDGLTGHSFGNLFLSAMTEITGDFEAAIAASSQVLAIRGCVLPATLSDVRLWAELDDGRRIEGESNIPEAKGRIARVGCTPENPPALPKAVEAIRRADYIIIGPGSLYTSIIPNLLVPGIADAIAASIAPCIYVCNVMSQPGETDHYSVGDHIAAIDRACGRILFDTVLVQKDPPSPRALDRYAREDSHPVAVDRDIIARLGRRVVLANVIDEDPQTGLVRHHSHKLGRMLLRWYDRLQELQEDP